MDLSRLTVLAAAAGLLIACHAKAMAPELYVDGNLIKTSPSKRFIVKGCAIYAVPFYLVNGHTEPTLETFADRNYNNRDAIFQAMVDVGINTIRLPLGARVYLNESYGVSKANQLQRIEDIVDSANDVGLYVILGFWDSLGMKQDWLTDYDLILEMLNDVHGQLGDNPMVMYEPFNEPNDVTWAQWKPVMEDTISYIRDTVEYEGILFIDTINWSWSFDTTYATNIINYDATVTGSDPNIVIANHRYCNANLHFSGTEMANWENSVGQYVDEYPIMGTEYGFHNPPHPDWNIEFLDYLAGNKVEQGFNGYCDFVWDWCDENNMTGPLGPNDYLSLNEHGQIAKDHFYSVDFDVSVTVDNTDSADVVDIGYWTPSTYTSGFLGTNYVHDGNTGKGTKSFSFKPSIAAVGVYHVYARWTTGSNRATNVPIDIVEADGSVTTVMVNQEENNGIWCRLGAFPLSPTNAEVKIRTTGTNGTVIADAVRVVPYLGDVTVDNSDSADVTSTGYWAPAAGVPGYLGSNYFHDSNTDKGFRTFSFLPPIPLAGSYRVYGRWTASANRATNVPVDIIKADGSVSTVTVNQEENGANWCLLGTFPLSPSNAEVKIRNGGTNGTVIADGVRVVPQFSDIKVIDDTFEIGSPAALDDDAGDERDILWCRANGGSSSSVASDGTLGSNVLSYSPWWGNRAIVGVLYGTSGRIPDSVTLGPNVGDEIRLTFDFRFTNLTNVDSYGSNFRFGLYNSNRTPFAADDTSYPANAVANNDCGYLAQVGLTEYSGAAQAVLRKESGSHGYATSGMDITTLTPTGSTAMLIDSTSKTYEAEFTLTRGAGSVDLNFHVFETTGGIHSLVGGATASDASDPYVTFDEILFSFGGNQARIAVDNVVLR